MYENIDMLWSTEKTQQIGQGRTKKALCCAYYNLKTDRIMLIDITYARSTVTLNNTKDAIALPNMARKVKSAQ